MSIFKNFFVSPQQNEVIETKINVDTNIKPALIGNVYDVFEKPIKEAFVAIYEVDQKQDKLKKLTGFTYTDDFGSFVLAPLEPNKLYNVKIYKHKNDARVLETSFD